MEKELISYIRLIETDAVILRSCCGTALSSMNYSRLIHIALHSPTYPSQLLELETRVLTSNVMGLDHRHDILGERCKTRSYCPG
jgi:hypothetical protein